MDVESTLHPIRDLYERPPQWFSSVGSKYRSFSARLRMGTDLTDLQHVANSESRWTDQQVEIFQLSQLRRTVRMAEVWCPFYRQRFGDAGISYLDLSTAEDLQHFPTMTRQDLQDHAEQIQHQRKMSRSWPLRRRGDLGGSEPELRVFDSSGEKNQIYLDQQLHRLGCEPKGRLVAIWDEPRGRLNRRRWSLDLTSNVLTLSARDLTPNSAEEYLHKIRKFKPQALVAHPSALAVLAAASSESRRRIPLDLRGILCVNEMLSSNQRRFFEAVFSTQVRGRYTHSEALVEAIQLSEKNHYYFSPSYGYAELDSPNEEGLREIIGTSFYNDRRPLIRFRTGDFVGPADEVTVGKEYPWLAVRGFVGHSDEFLLSRSGRKVWPVRFSINKAPIRNVVSCQFVQPEPGRLTLRFIAITSFDQADRVALRRYLQKAVGKGFKIQLEQVDWLPRQQDGSLQRVIREPSPTY